MRRIVRFLLLVILVANRGATKLPVGPVFLLDATLMLALIGKPLTYVRLSLRHLGAVVMALLAMAWLLADLLGSGGEGGLVLRRFAVAAYVLVPLVLMVHPGYFRFIRSAPGLIAAGSVLLSIVLPNASGTLSAQTAALMLLVSIFAVRRYRVMHISLSALSFALASLGLVYGESAFRAPIAGLLATAVVFATLGASRLLTRRTASRRNIALALLLMAVLPATMFSELGKNLAGEMVAGVAGLSGSTALANVGRSLTTTTDRGRGDAVGTASTRVEFWRGILTHNAESPNRLLLGNGHSSGFFDAVFPGQVFLDQELLEPHNSFVGVFFRYGLMGVVGLLWLMVSSRRRSLKAAWPVGERPPRAYLWSTAILAVMYAALEVALESPHGAVLFWTMWLAPAFTARPHEPAHTPCGGDGV